MALQVIFSNSIKKLATQLAENLTTSHAGDPFQKPRVIIPNLSMQKWLQMKIADQNRVTANVDFTFLEKGLWNTLLELSGDQDEPVLIDASTLKFMISAVLRSEADSEKIQWKYIREEDGEIDERKLWQLSSKLAVFFKEYENNRPSMTEAWRKEQLTSDDAIEQMEFEIFNDSAIGQCKSLFRAIQ